MQLIRPLMLFGATLFSTLLLGGCPTSFPSNSNDVLGNTTLSLRTVPANARLNSDVAEAPITMIGGLPFVEVTINDAGPFLFLVDTGAATTVVIPAVAALFPENINLSEVRIFDSTSDAIPSKSALQIDSLRLADLELNDFDAVTIDLSNLSQSFGTEVHGILGFPAFANLLLTIDYNENMLRVSDQLLDPNSPDAVSMTIIDGHPFVDVRIGETVVSTMLDTGHGGSYSLPLDTPGITYSAQPMPWFSSMDLSGPSPRQIGRLAGDVELGPVLWETPIITVDGPDTANIGSGLMSLFVVSFDQRSGLVELASDGEQRILQSAPISTFGIQISDNGTERIVSEVLAGSPAEAAGIEAGDALVSVDGINAGLVVPAVTTLPVQTLTIEVERPEGNLVANVNRTVWVE